MRKIMLVAATLAMVLVSAVPAFARSVAFEGDGDATDQSVHPARYTVAEFGDQTATIEQNVAGDGNETGAAIGQSQARVGATGRSGTPSPTTTAASRSTATTCSSGGSRQHPRIARSGRAGSFGNPALSASRGGDVRCPDSGFSYRP